MRKVIVRSATGELSEMVAVEESEKLIYVVSVDSLSRLENGLTEPVGCPKNDVISQSDKPI